MTNIKRVDSGLFQADQQAVIRKPVDTSWLDSIDQVGNAYIDKASKQADEDAFNDAVKQQLTSGSASKTVAYTGGGFWDQASKETAFQKGTQLAQGLQIQNDTETQMQSAYLQNKDDPKALETALQTISESTLKNTPSALIGDTTARLMDMKRKYNGQAASDAYAKQIDAQKATGMQALTSRKLEYDNYVRTNGIDGTSSSMLNDINKLRGGLVESRLIDPAQAIEDSHNTAVLTRRAQAWNDFNKNPTEQTIEKIRDPNGLYKDLGADAQDSIGGDISQEFNRRKTLSAGDRASNSKYLDSVLYNIKSGDKNQTVDIPTETAKMRSMNYSDTEIQNFTDQATQAVAVRNQVLLLDSQHIDDQTKTLAAKQKEVDSIADPVAKANAREQLGYMTSRYTENKKLIEDGGGYDYVQARFPDQWAKFDFSTAAGAEQARSATTAITGNPNAQMLPDGVASGWKQSLASAPDASTRGRILEQMDNSYGSDMPRIAEQLGITPTQIFAAHSDNDVSTEALQAEQLYPDTKSLLPDKTKSQDPAFDAAFPITDFAGDGKLRGQLRTTYDQLTAKFVSDGMEEGAAQTKAQATINKTYKAADINGQSLIIPKTADGDKLSAAVKNLNDHYDNYTFVQSSTDGKSVTVMTNSEVADKIHSNQFQLRPDGKGNYMIHDTASTNGGSAVYVRTKDGNAAQVLFGPDGTAPALGYVDKESTTKKDPVYQSPAIASDHDAGWDGTATNVDTITRHPPVHTVYGKNSHMQVKDPDWTDTNAMAINAGLQAKKQDLPIDDYALQVTKDPNQRDALTGISHVVKGGTLPDWAATYLKSVDGFEGLGKPQVRAKVTAAWAANTDHSKSPLKTLYGMTQDAYREFNSNIGATGRYHGAPVTPTTQGHSAPQAPTETDTPTTPVTPTAPQAGKKDTIGVRNNNPGNLRNGVDWNGSSQGEGGFAAFNTPENGTRALAKNLLAYQDKHNLNTVADIVNRWAPSNENDTGSYVKAVAKDMGVSANDKLDLHNKDTLHRLTRAIIKHENGSIPYDPKVISNGVDAALGDA